MTKAELHAAAMALPAATLDIKWGDDRCYCVGGKMFCATDGEYRTLSFKATDIAYEALTQSGRAKPAPYAARFKWVQFDDLGALDADEVGGWLRTAHGLVSGKLSKKAQRELGLA
jgi:predicted DNA-binding protein (MmcQ/YjbR family)